MSAQGFMSGAYGQALSNMMLARPQEADSLEGALGMAMRAQMMQAQMANQTAEADLNKAKLRGELNQQGLMNNLNFNADTDPAEMGLRLIQAGVKPEMAKVMMDAIGNQRRINAGVSNLKQMGPAALGVPGYTDPRTGAQMMPLNDEWARNLATAYDGKFDDMLSGPQKMRDAIQAGVLDSEVGQDLLLKMNQTIQGMHSPMAKKAAAAGGLSDNEYQMQMVNQLIQHAKEIDPNLGVALTKVYTQKGVGGLQKVIDDGHKAWVDIQEDLAKTDESKAKASYYRGAKTDKTLAETEFIEGPKTKESGARTQELETQAGVNEANEDYIRTKKGQPKSGGDPGLNNKIKVLEAQRKSAVKEVSDAMALYGENSQQYRNARMGLDTLTETLNNVVGLGGSSPKPETAKPRTGRRNARLDALRQLLSQPNEYK